VKPIRVLVVDDEELFREGIARLLESAPDIAVVATVAAGADAAGAVIAHRPDVVLMDVQMPGTDGLQAAAAVLEVAPGTAVVMLTSFLYDEYILPALHAGAAGYLLKDSSPDELRDGVRSAAAGDAILSPAVTRRLLDAVAPSLSTRRVEAVRAVATLSDRERDVVACLVEGLSNAEIGQRLFLAEPTIKTLLTRIMGKLGAANRTQAAILAVEAGLGET
jgi:DNA-binding NarL/FixJ family response regulator